MKIIQNCRNPKCLAKNSMISIVTKEYYTPKRKNNDSDGKDKKKYPTNKTHAVFYICKECTEMSNFRLNDICEGGNLFSICLVPKDEESKIDEIKGMKKPNCAYCGFSKFPMNPQIDKETGKEERTQDNIIKLWIKGKFFGYYCKVHSLAFCKKIEEVNWDVVKNEWMNVLDPLNRQLSRYTIEKKCEDKKVRKYELDLTNKSIPTYIILKKDRFDENRSLLIELVEFKKTSQFPTTSGPIESANNFQQVSVMIPQNKMNKFKKWLEKHDCKIN